MFKSQPFLRKIGPRIRTAADSFKIDRRWNAINGLRIDDLDLRRAKGRKN